MNLPNGWYRTNQDEESGLKKELELEMVQGHFLFGKKLSVIAHRNGANDDILCKHLEDTNKYTVAHLTWAMKPEINEKFPMIEFHGTFEDFLNWEKSYSPND